jgi:hypothetical protein
MLYTGCSFCGNVAPLYCGWRFMPHLPIPVLKIPSGAGCQICGPMLPIFTCNICWTTQMLYFPGLSNITTRSMPGMSQYVAPVVQANSGSSEHEVKEKIYGIVKATATSVASSVGKEIVISIFKAWNQPR